MRNTFISSLVDHAAQDENIILMVGDLGFGAVEPFQESFPSRFFNVGIAEQNMAGMAAGLASRGFHVFNYSIGNFPTFRAAEHIRNDIDYHNFSVTTVSIGGGVAYGSLGYSHHTFQDFSLMRSFPNMIILAPCDPEETMACLSYILKFPQPSYLRLGNNG
jgi:transketolase